MSKSSRKGRAKKGSRGASGSRAKGSASQKKAKRRVWKHQGR